MEMQKHHTKSSIGTLKSKWINLFFVTYLFISCENKQNLSQKFIEDNFLEIVDTMAYSTGAFVSPPRENINYSQLSVNLTQKITYNKKIDEITQTFFEKNKDLKSSFKELLENNTYSEFSLNSTFPKQIGKYHIFFNGNNIDKKIKYAGRIDIGNFKIHKDKAILILAESMEKYGTIYVILFKKEGVNWKIFKREVLGQS
jgi:hypothetical protein